MIAHGFTVARLVQLVQAGIATATAERVVAGGCTIVWGACGSPRQDGGRWRTEQGGEDSREVRFRPKRKTFARCEPSRL